MQNKNENTAWSLYWSQDRLHSCVASDGDKDQEVLNQVWRDFAAKLAADSKVLDLATGNGAVPAALMLSRPDLLIDAVDHADIDPDQYLSGHDELKSVQFHGSVDINSMSFEGESFSALTSQFGIEYAGLSAATIAALEFLQAGGLISFVIHHSDSAIIKSSAKKIIEIEQLLKEGGLIETLMLVLRDATTFAELESVGQDYLQQDYLRTQQISGQVFAAIEEIGKLMTVDMPKALNLGATLRLRLESELQRLVQMADAAQSEADMTSYRSVLDSEGLEIEQIKPIYVDDSEAEYLLGWLVQASKP